MEELVDVTICDPLDFDENIFLSWLKGKKSQEATEAHIDLVANYWTLDMDNEGSNIFGIAEQQKSGLYNLLEQEIIDHYRSYEFLEYYICQPWLLTNQIMIRMPDHTIQWVIGQYYSLDDAVARSLVGKRLSKNRRELEDISENNQISLTSVTRQLENLNRVYLSLEDLQFQVNFSGFLESTYALPQQIARKYACLLFLVAGRFDVSSKKRLQRLTCSSFENCAAATMACLLPDQKTFLEFNSGSFDVENLNIPPESELQDKMSFTDMKGPQGKGIPITLSSASPIVNASLSIPSHSRATSENEIEAVDNIENVLHQQTSNSKSTDMDISLLPIGRSKSVPTSHGSNHNGSHVQSPWIGIWKLVAHPMVNATEPDKQLLTNLRELRTLFTTDVMEVAVAEIRKEIATMHGGLTIIKKLEGRMKAILKSLTGIGGHLSQSKEYRDIYDDILNIVGESLHEAGLDRHEANTYLIACNSSISCAKDILFRKLDRLGNAAKYKKISMIEVDWNRFMLCCRICIWNMFEVLSS